MIPSHNCVRGAKVSHLMVDLDETLQHYKFVHSVECNHTKILSIHKSL